MTPSSSRTMSVLSFTRRFAVPHWPLYLAGTVALAVVNLITLEVPQLAKQIVNQLSAGQGDSDTLSQMALTIVGLGFLMIVIRALSRILIFWPGRKLEAQVKSDLFRKTLRLPEAFFAKFGLGDLISRLANDVNHARVFFAFGLLQILNMIFLLGFTIQKMVQVHSGLTVACLLPLLAMIGVSRFAMPYMHKYSRASQDALGRLTNRVTEAFANVHVLQANSCEQTFSQRSQIENDAVYDSNIKLILVRTVIFPMMTLLAGVSQVVVLFYGGREVLAGRLTIGDILAFNVYISLLTFPLTAMGIILAVFQRFRTALDRLSDLDEAPEEGVKKGAEKASVTPLSQSTDSSTRPLLEVKNLEFSYPMAGVMDEKGEEATKERSESRFQLHGISFAIKPGQKLGLYGPIGSGKSTLFHLIARLYDPPAGAIFWQGQDILEIVPKELRARIAYALQNVHLFSASIEENLTFGLVDRPDQPAIVAASRAAQIHDEVVRFPGGYQTEIGEKGVRLSGGQKQRLALARLFLRKPDLVILDDVTSAVDHQTEQNLLDAISHLGAGLLMASHRAGALGFCDEIIMLRDGTIVDRGTLAELITRHPELQDDEEEVG